MLLYVWDVAPRGRYKDAGRTNPKVLRMATAGLGGYVSCAWHTEIAPSAAIAGMSPHPGRVGQLGWLSVIGLLGAYGYRRRL